MADWTKRDESSEAKPLFVGTSRKGYHETRLCGKTVNPKPAISCHHAIIYKLWTGTMTSQNCDTPRILLMIVSYLSSATKKIVVQNLAEDCNSNSKLLGETCMYGIWYVYQMQLALRYTKIKPLEKLWSCIADDQYYHSSSAYMSGGRNQKGERPFPNTSVVPMTCEGKGSYIQDL